MKQRPLELAVLISGGGRTLLNLHQRINEGSLRAHIAVVVSSRGEATGVDRSRALGLPTVVVDRGKLLPEAFRKGIAQAMAGLDLACMAGFRSLWTIPKEWRGRVINIHPALLPEFGGKGMYGRRVHESVLAAGKSVSGCTVHFCDNEYDHGPIILQRQVPVLASDTPETLAARVFEQECIAYPQTIQLFADGLIRLDGHHVKFTEDTDACV